MPAVVGAIPSVTYSLPVQGYNSASDSHWVLSQGTWVLPGFVLFLPNHVCIGPIANQVLKGKEQKSWGPFWAWQAWQYFLLVLQALKQWRKQMPVWKSDSSSCLHSPVLLECRLIFLALLQLCSELAYQGQPFLCFKKAMVYQSNVTLKSC